MRVSSLSTYPFRQVTYKLSSDIHFFAIELDVPVLTLKTEKQNEHLLRI